MAFGLPPVAPLEPHGFPRSVEIDLGDKPSHEVAFICDDIDATIEQLRASGVEFRAEPEEMGLGRRDRDGATGRGRGDAGRTSREPAELAPPAGQTGATGGTGVRRGDLLRIEPGQVN